MKNRKQRPNGGYLVNVSFTPDEENLLEHADKQGNFSFYVKSLIRADMEKNKQALSGNIQELLLGLIGEKGLKDILQNDSKEVAVDKEEKPKANKSKVNNLMKNLKNK